MCAVTYLSFSKAPLLLCSEAEPRVILIGTMRRRFKYCLVCQRLVLTWLGSRRARSGFVACRSSLLWLCIENAGAVWGAL